MKNLTPYIAPVVEKPACHACKAMAPTCNAPVGEGSLPMCWLCAHQVVEHGWSLEQAGRELCGCLPRDIFPLEVLTARELRTATLKAVAS